MPYGKFPGSHALIPSPNRAAASRNVKPGKPYARVPYDAAQGRTYKDVTMKLKAVCLASVCAVLVACGGSINTEQSSQPHSVPAPRIIVPARSNVVAFMGDSITYYWGPFMPAESWAVDNFGQSGNLTWQMLARFQTQVIDASPEVGVVVIDGGVNDLIHPDQLEGGTTALQNIETMAQMATQAGMRVIIASVMLEDYTAAGIVNPSTAQIDAFNEQLMTLCQENGYLYADYRDAMLLPDGTQDFSLYIDGLHPNETGYARMWAVIEPLIAEDLT